MRRQLRVLLSAVLGPAESVRGLGAPVASAPPPAQSGATSTRASSCHLLPSPRRPGLRLRDHREEPADGHRLPPLTQALLPRGRRRPPAAGQWPSVHSCRGRTALIAVPKQNPPFPFCLPVLSHTVSPAWNILPPPAPFPLPPS